jgi:hypothetical protein
VGLLFFGRFKLASFRIAKTVRNSLCLTRARLDEEPVVETRMIIAQSANPLTTPESELISAAASMVRIRSSTFRPCKIAFG